MGKILKIDIDGIIFSLQRNGGISVYFNELISYLIQNTSHEIILTVQDDYFLSNLNRFDNSIIKINRSRLFERYRSASPSFSHGIFHSSYYRNTKKKNSKNVVTVHDFIYEKFNRGIKKHIHSWQKGNSIKSADAIICVSNATKNDLLHYFDDIDPSKITVIHNGVSKDFFYKEIYDCKSTPFILFVGHRAGYKNFQLVINSLKFLPEVELICVGGPPLTNIELNSIPSIIASRIKHLGIVSNSTLNDLYNTAICLVYPSKYEGFGIPVIEAMSAGCPVVSSKCDAVLEIGKNALFVIEDDDPILLANEIIRIMNSNRSNLVKKSLIVASQYSWVKTHHKTVEVYNQFA